MNDGRRQRGCPLSTCRRPDRVDRGEVVATAGVLAASGPTSADGSG
jgi:hypothetical protein